VWLYGHVDRMVFGPAAKVPLFECYGAIVDSLSRLLHGFEHCVEIRANSGGNRAIDLVTVNTRPLFQAIVAEQLARVFL
jgi:hypothetical protein